MNAIFDIKRFGKYEFRNLFLNKQIYLSLVYAFGGVYILFFLIWLLIGFNPSSILETAISVCICFSIYFFEKKINKNKSVFDFTLPASTFEKFLHILIKHVLFIPFVIIGTLTILNFIAGLFFIDNSGGLIDSMALSAWMNWNDFFKLIQLQSIFIMGYYLFKNNSFLKTLLGMTLYLIVIVIFIGIIFKVTFDGISSITTFQNVNVIIDSNFVYANTNENYLKWIIIAIFPIGMWVVSYFKFREKEL